MNHPGNTQLIHVLSPHCTLVSIVMQLCITSCVVCILWLVGRKLTAWSPLLTAPHRCLPSSMIQRWPRHTQLYSSRPRCILGYTSVQNHSCAVKRLLLWQDKNNCPRSFWESEVSTPQGCAIRTGNCEVFFFFFVCLIPHLFRKKGDLCID